jgi:hypothetical protein
MFSDLDGLIKKLEELQQNALLYKGNILRVIVNYVHGLYDSREMDDMGNIRLSVELLLLWLLRRL